MTTTMITIPSEHQISLEFQRLLAERKRLESKVTTKEELAAKEQDKKVVELASTYTVESIVKGLAELQLTFDRMMERAFNQLTTESSKLEEVRRAIEVERKRLEELHHIEIAANALDILIQEYETKRKLFHEQTTQQRETFEQEVSSGREAWQKQEAEHLAAQQEYQERLQKERILSEDDHNYELERSRKIALDNYEAKKREIERELAEKEADKQKDWAAREEVIADHQDELKEFKAKIEAFPDELEEAKRKARDEAIKEANQSAKVKAELMKKEVEANQKVYELTIQTLEESIERQHEQIARLSEELKEALGRVQGLATSAIGNTKTA